MWNDGGDLSFYQCVSKAVGVIAFVGQRGLGLRKVADHLRSPLIVAHLPFA